MLFNLFVLFSLTLTSKAFDCIFNDDCSRFGHFTNLICHPLLKKCAECAISSDCNQISSYCTPEGSCIGIETECEFDKDCQESSDLWVCIEGLCKNANFHAKPRKGPSNIRNLGVTTTTSGKQVAVIDNPVVRMYLSKNEKILFISTGANGLAIYDVTTRAKPSLLSKYKGECTNSTDIIASDDEKTLYLLTTSRLCIFDIRNVYQPVLITISSDVYGTTLSKFKNSMLLAITDGLEYISLTNVTNPTSVMIISNIFFKNVPTKAVTFSNDEKMLVLTKNEIHVFDISTLESPTLILTDQNFYGSYLVISEEESTAYVAGDVFMVIDMSDLSSLSMLGSYTPSSDTNDLIVNSEMNMAYLSSLWLGTIILDFSDLSNIVESGKFLSKYAKSVIANPDFTLFFVGDLSLGLIVFQIEQFQTTIVNNVLGSSLVKEYGNMVPSGLEISKDEALVYVASMGSGIHIINISDYKNSYLIKTLKYSHSGFLDLKFTSDYKYMLYSGYPDGLFIFDMSDPLNPVNLSVIPSISEEDFRFDITEDGRFLAIAQQYYGMDFYDITDKNSPVFLGKFDKYVSDVSFFKNDYLHIAAILETSFSILNITSFENIAILSSTRTVDPYSLALSPDEKYAFVADSRDGVRVVDISNYLNISLVTIIPGTDSFLLYYSTQTNLLYISDYDINIGVYVVDVSDPKIPINKGIVSAVDPSFVKVTSSNILYLCDKSDGFQIIDMNAEYVLKTNSNISPLGTITTFNILVGRLQGTKYIPYNSVYKIIEMALYSMEFDLTSGNYLFILSPLPTWIKGDVGKGQIIFSSENLNQIGKYDIFIGISTIVKIESFIGIGNITTLHLAEDFFTFNLLGKYVDSEGYLLSSFDPSLELILEAKYSEFEEDIRHMLSRNYIQSTIELEVIPSLEIGFSSDDGLASITFDTPSLALVVVKLELNDPNAVFMEVPYKSSAFFGYLYSGVIITGSTFDVNLALALLRVDLKSNITQSAGKITINDGLNPEVATLYQNFTEFFMINEPPFEKIKVQEQIDKVEILTGIQFSLILDPNTFVDPDSDTLTYKLETIDGKNLPAWIRMVDTTILGTPPEELGLKVPLKIIASDGYKTVETMFVIKVSPSTSFIFSLILKYIGPIIGAIGCWIYAITIYNIVFKHLYTYPRIFYLRPNVPIHNGLIYPISLYGFELREAIKILKAIKKFLNKEGAKRMKKPLTKEQTDAEKKNEYDDEDDDKNLGFEEKILDAVDIVRLLANKDGTIDDLKLENLVEETVKKANLKLNRYFQSKLPYQRRQILKIIRERLTKIMIENNKPTFKVYNALIAENWSNLCRPSLAKKQVNNDFDNFEFELCEAFFYKKLGSIGFQVKNDVESRVDVNSISNNNLNSSPQRETLIRDCPKAAPQIALQKNSKLKALIKINPNEVNMPLLKEAILAFYNERYNLGMPETRINFRCLRADIRTGFVARIKKMLKLDLIEVSFNNKNSLGYGVKYKILNDKVYFYGRPYREFEGNTLVFQILSKKDKILREIIIKGEGEESEVEEVRALKYAEENERVEMTELKLNIDQSVTNNKSGIGSLNPNKSHVNISDADFDANSVEEFTDDYVRSSTFKSSFSPSKFA